MPVTISHVPTNIISGFLGVGKTTAILSLFEQKRLDDQRAGENWAILVNEFGKVGIDGRIYEAQGIAVREIPGGCMCCAQGLPLQVAVNRLLREAQPDRLIIESSGVGHPAGVLKTLGGDDFKHVLKLQAGICLVDPEQLLQPAYQDNELFKEQLLYADVLVANKTDLASVRAMRAFTELVESYSPQKVLTASTVNAHLDPRWLVLPHRRRDKTVFSSLSAPAVAQSDAVWQTRTLRFSEDSRIDLNMLQDCLRQAGLQRAKGLLQTEDGCKLINYHPGHFEDQPFQACREDDGRKNYLEVIGAADEISRFEDCLGQTVPIV